MANTITYTIPNISCGHCVHTIQSEVTELEGVQSVDANMDTKQATITFEPPATEEKIKSLLAEINYPAAA
jgi:copper chaperone